jgi:hypothetical protein
MNKKIAQDFEEREEPYKGSYVLLNKVKILKDTQGTLEEKHDHCIKMKP